MRSLPRTAPVVIELDEVPLGILMEEGERVVFHAVHPKLSPLHGRGYDDPLEARREAAAAFRTAA